MRYLVLSLSLVAVIAGYSVRADDTTRHIVGSASGAEGPTALDAIDQRLREDAQEYAEEAPVSRIGLYDSALPANPDEYAALDGYGVILITVVSQHREELPPKRVYAHVDGKLVELKLFKAGFAPRSGDAEVQRVLGDFRWDGLYYYPAYLTLKATDLEMDFAAHRDGFVLGQFDPAQAGLPPALESVKVAPPHGDQPPPAAFLKMVEREYPGLMQELDSEAEAGPPSDGNLYVLDGYKLGQPMALVEQSLGTPDKSVQFDDGWKAVVYRKQDYYAIFEMDPHHPDLIAAIQIEGKDNPAGLGLHGVDLGMDPVQAARILGKPDARTPSIDEETHQPVKDTFLDKYQDRNYSFEEEGGKVSSIKITLATNFLREAQPDIGALLQILRSKDYYAAAGWISVDLIRGGKRLVEAPMLSALAGPSALHDVLYGPAGVAALSESDFSESEVRVIAAEPKQGVPESAGVVFKFKEKPFSELYFMVSREGWVLYSID